MRVLSWKSAITGNLRPLDGTAGVLIGRDVEGLEAPPMELVLDQRVGTDGAVLASRRSPHRTLVMPLLIDERVVDYGTIVREMQEGTIQSVNPADPLAPRQLRSVVYEEGFEGVWGIKAGGMAGTHRRRCSVTFQVLDPWWYGMPRSVPLLFAATATPWNSANPWSPALPWNGGASTTITVDGDAAATPFFDVYGPVSDITVAISAASLSRRYGWRSVQALSAGQRLTVDHRWASRGPRLQGAPGPNWALLTPASRLFTLPKGQSTIVAGIIGSTSATNVTMYWEPRWLTP